MTDFARYQDESRATGAACEYGALSGLSALVIEDGFVRLG
jgi:hypothetical protein